MNWKILYAFCVEIILNNNYFFKICANDCANKNKKGGDNY